MADLNPICQCGERFRPIKNGILVDYAGDQVQHGDLYQCRGCGHEIITGLGFPHPRPLPTTANKEENK